MTPFWINKPTILLNKCEITNIWPEASMSQVGRLNAISRMIILLSIIGYSLIRDLKFIYVGVLTLVVIAFYYYQYVKEQKRCNKEGFKSSENLSKNLSEKLFTLPTEENPLMNVMPNDNKYNPNRLPAAPAADPNIKQSITDSVKKFVVKKFDDPSIKKKLFEDLGDNNDLEDSMHNWYTTANTQIPNDQHAFANFCYGDTAYCKDNPCFRSQI